MYRLDYIMTLAEEKNITKAAERLYISQPTLTKYINRLESELGVRLFDRSVQPIQMTKAGIVFIEDMKKIQYRELMLRAKLQEIGREKSNVRISIGSVRGEYVLPHAVAEFLKEYPDVSVTVDSRQESIMEKSCVECETDIILGVLSTAYDDLKYELFMDFEIFILLPRREFDISKEEGTLDHPYIIDSQSLNGHRLLIPAGGGGQYQAAEKVIKKYNIILMGEIRGANPHALYQMVSLGLGIMVTTPQDFVNRFPKETEDIVFCRLSTEIIRQRVYLACRRDETNPVIHKLVSCLKKRTAEIDPEVD